MRTVNMYGNVYGIYGRLEPALNLPAQEHPCVHMQMQACICARANCCSPTYASLKL